MWAFLLTNLRILFLASGILAAVVGTWKVQEWRYAAKEMEFLVEQQAFIKREAVKQAKAAATFENKLEYLNEIYKRINKALKDISNNPMCFSPEQLRLLNNALGRTAPDSAKPSGSVP